MDIQAAPTSSGLISGLKIVAASASAGVLIQAWLGSSGFFQGKPGFIDVHEMIANLFFLLMIAQVALAFFSMQKGFASRNVLYLSLMGLALTVAQIGLGYGTRSSVDALAWHLPVGVLLMGTTAVAAAMVWNGNRSHAAGS